MDYNYLSNCCTQRANGFFFSLLQLTVKVLSSGALHCLCIFIPFIVFQAHGYYNICWGHAPDQISPWCKARPPLLYNYIQSRYWYVINVVAPIDLTCLLFTLIANRQPVRIYYLYLVFARIFRCTSSNDS